MIKLAAAKSRVLMETGFLGRGSCVVGPRFLHGPELESVP